MKNKIFIVFIWFFGACNLFINQDSDQKGIIAMVELESCKSKSYANELMIKRGFDKLEWIDYLREM